MDFEEKLKKRLSEFPAINSEFGNGAQWGYAEAKSDFNKVGLALIKMAHFWTYFMRPGTASREILIPMILQMTEENDPLAFTIPEVNEVIKKYDLKSINDEG